MAATTQHWNDLAKYLAKRSAEICRDNDCTEDRHECDSYAYLTADGQVIDICCPDYFCGYSGRYAAIPLPYDGDGAQLADDVAEETYAEEDEEA